MWKKAVLLMAISTCMVGNVVAQSIIDVHCHNILPFLYGGIGEAQCRDG